jgi:hypothetical protein
MDSFNNTFWFLGGSEVEGKCGGNSSLLYKAAEGILGLQTSKKE